jgi:predicted Co/Zn/Cd cation transporter (cation efflux family)
MKRKTTVLMTALFSLTSSVFGQGYGGAINQSLNPEGLEQVLVLYETVGWHLAAILAAPLLVVLAAGYSMNEWKRENYWELLFLYTIIGFGAIGLYPLILVNL